MVRIIFFFLGTAVVTPTIPANSATPPTDSTQQKKQSLAVRVTARTHSSSFFYYGGKVAESNPAFDLHTGIEHKNFGLTLFRAVDLANAHSSYNFALAAVYKNILVTKKLKFTPQVLVLLEQPYKFADKGSDVGYTFTTTYKLNNNCSIEETFILFNLIFEQQHMDMINRLRFLYQYQHVDLMLTAWHNNGLIDTDEHATVSLTAGLNRLKLGKTFSLGIFGMAATQQPINAEGVRQANRFVLSLHFMATN
jgi:hypothetical protein